MNNEKKDKKMNLRMKDFADGYLQAILYLQDLQSDCDEQKDWDTLQVSIEMLQGEYEMMPVVKGQISNAE